MMKPDLDVDSNQGPSDQHDTSELTQPPKFSLEAIPVGKTRQTMHIIRLVLICGGMIALMRIYHDIHVFV